MAITATFRVEVRPGDAAPAIAAVRAAFVDGRQRPARQHARLFQRLNSPTELLAVGEWESREAVEQFIASPCYADLVAACGQPPSVRYFARVRWFERVLQPVAVAACAIVAATPATRDAVEAYLRGDAYEEAIRAPGLRCLQLDRALAAPSLSLTGRGWAALDDLERFRREVAPRHEATLAGIGASVDRFTGDVVADTNLIT